MTDSREITVTGLYNQVVGDRAHDNTLTTHVHYGSAAVRLTGFPGRAELPPRGGERPALLLNARYEVISFVGRDEQLAELESWRDDSVPAAVKLLHGTGGQGKTRLAMEIARRSGEAGWTVLAASAIRAGTPVPGPGDFVGELPSEPGKVLLVVDYADCWPREHLAYLLGKVAGMREVRYRVLFVARGDGTWWKDISDAYAPLMTMHALRLRPLLDDGLTADEVFDQAFRAFAARLGGPVAADRSQMLSFPRNGNPPRDVLSIHMTALVVAVRAVEAAASGGRAVSMQHNDNEVVGYLLERESRHMRRLLGEKGREIDADVLIQTSVIVALLGPQNYLKVRSVLEGCGIGASEPERDRVLKDFVSFYPSAASELIALPFPDRVIEDMCGMVLAEPWGAALAPRVADAAPDLVGTILDTLIAAAQRWPDLYPRHIFPILDADPARITKVTSSVFQLLADSGQLGGTLFDRVLAAVVGQPRGFEAGIKALVVQLVNHATRTRDPERDPQAMAGLYEILAVASTAAGDSDYALEARRIELACRSTLAAADFHRYAPKLAEALLTMSDQLALVGAADDALMTARSSVSILERLVQHDEQHAPALAWALNANALRERALADADEEGDSHRNRDAEQAVTVALLRRAEAVFRDLPDDGADSWKANFGVTLSHLGAMLSSTDIDEALSLGAESVRLLDEAVGTEPSPNHRRALAVACLNLGQSLVQAGREKEGFEYLTGALKIYGELGGAENRATSAEHAAALRAVGRRQIAKEQPLAGLCNVVRGTTWYFQSGLSPELQSVLCETTHLYEALELKEDVEETLATKLSHDELAVVRLCRSLHTHTETSAPKRFEWALRALQADPESPSILGWARMLARQYGGSTEPSEREGIWRKVMGGGVIPASLRIDDDLFTEAVNWAGASDAGEEYEALRISSRLSELSPAIHDAVLMTAASGNHARAAELADRWRSVVLHGPETAYRPLLLEQVVHEFAEAEQADRARIYSAEAEQLQSEAAHKLLSDLAQASNRDDKAAFDEAHVILHLIDELRDPEAVFAATAHRTALLNLLATTAEQTLTAVPLIAMLVSTDPSRLSDLELRAEAAFYLAVAFLDQNPEMATSSLRDALNCRPDRRDTWRQILGHLAERHPDLRVKLRAMRGELSEMEAEAERGAPPRELIRFQFNE